MYIMKNFLVKSELSDHGMVCCFCKKILTEDFYIDDTGRLFCNKRCRWQRIDMLKGHKGGSYDEEGACSALLPEQRDNK